MTTLANPHKTVIDKANDILSRLLNTPTTLSADIETGKVSIELENRVCGLNELPHSFQSLLHIASRLIMADYHFPEHSIIAIIDGLDNQLDRQFQRSVLMNLTHSFSQTQFIVSAYDAEIAESCPGAFTFELGNDSN